MTKFETIDDIRKALQELLKAQESLADDEDAFQVFHHAYLQLLERFYKENTELIAYQQYEAAKSDPEDFMRLVMLAYEFHKDNEPGGFIVH